MAPMQSEQTEERPVSDRPGLSIFDDPDDNGSERGPGRDDEATQVIPAVRQQHRPTPPTQPSASAPRAEASTPAASTGGRPTFPVVRRGGYDPAVVDRQMHTLAGERAGLTAGLNESKARVASLEKELAALRERVSEQDSPTYAGLGGRASEMLRLAEEQADEVLVQARAQADEVRRQASKDADVLKAQAARDAEDMRMVQLKELDETRARALADVEQERAMAKAEADDLLAAAERDSSATAETQKLVEEAEARANAAEARTREAANAAHSHRKGAHEEAER